MKKKVSIPVLVTVALIAAALAFSAAYIIATESTNAQLADYSEKQAMYSSLSNFDGEVKYLTAEEFEAGSYTEADGYTVVKLSDGAVIVISENSEKPLTTQASEIAPSTAETQSSATQVETSASETAAQ